MMSCLWQIKAEQYRVDLEAVHLYKDSYTPEKYQKLVCQLVEVIRTYDRFSEECDCQGNHVATAVDALFIG